MVGRAARSIFKKATVKNEFEKKHYLLGLIKLEAKDGLSIVEKILERAKQYGNSDSFYHN